MKYSSLSRFLAILRCFSLIASTSALEVSSPDGEGRFTTLSNLDLVRGDESRFSMRIAYGVNTLPATAVFLNIIELSAQYAEMDYMGRTGDRHGIVLADWPQVEIALLAARGRRGIDVRFALWGLYGALLDMVFSNRFIESEVEITWDDLVVASIFITQPLDVDTAKASNATTRLIPPLPGNSTDESSDAVSEPVNAGTGRFDWRPRFAPSDKIMPPSDIFILIMGTIKAVAPHAMTDKVKGAFHVGSGIVDANLQAYLKDRRVPRPVPPYFQFAHVLEAVRRIPAWMLARRRFAEFACSIEVSTKHVGSILIEKGPYRPDSISELDGELDTS